MSTGSHSFPKLPRGPDVLGELLHSLSQPLTSLRCSLELSISIDEVAEKRQETVSVALQQTEKVIGMIQLMREYLDAEQPGPEVLMTKLALSTWSVVEALSSIAAVRGVRLRLAGTCTVRVPLPESRLRLALQYLITAIIEAQPPGSKVMLLLGEGPAGAVLRVEGECDRKVDSGNNARCGSSQTKLDRTKPDRAEFDRSNVPTASLSTSTLRRVRLAIASRVLETAGASLVFSEHTHSGAAPVGFILRIPRRVLT
jgi:hypothetical protein